ncbi:hypothetical protein ALC60_03778, partial [Trachymyrmex zeteki]
VDHIRSVGIRACLSTILSPVLEESPRSQGSEAEDGRARPKSRDLVDGIIGCTPRNAHECVSSVIVGVSLAPYLPAPKPETRISEDVPSDSFIRRELNAHLLLKHVGFMARRGLDFLISELLPR